MLQTLQQLFHLMVMIYACSTYIYTLCLLIIKLLSTLYTLNGKQVPMEVDTGATKSVMSEHTWRSLGQPKLNKCDLILKTYTGESLTVKGMVTVEVQFNQLRR